MTSRPDPHTRPGSQRIDDGPARAGSHDDHTRGESSERIGTAKKNRWLLPVLLAVGLLLALLAFLFVGDNDVDNSPDSVDQIGNNQPGNCGSKAAGGEDKGVGDIAPDDENDCPTS